MGSAGHPADVVLDCRWLDVWGAGKVAELLLRGLADSPPPGSWVLWGPPAVERYVWPGARWAVTTTDPRALLGQRAWLDVPAGRLVVFLHQQRPLCNVPAVTFILDTIQLRHGGSRLERRARTFYLRRVARLSREIVTISDYSKACIRRDLGIDESRITTVPLPLEEEHAERVSALRRGLPTGNFALFIGRFAPHKNLERLLDAFGMTRFCSRGGRLVLAGGSPEQVKRLAEGLTDRQRSFVDVRPWCEQAVLDQLLATARLLVQPSLEEGFGLPVMDALAAGVPVCVSDGGALPEITRGLAHPFSATSVEAMARALDECVDAGQDPERLDQLAREMRRRALTTRQYAAEFQRIVERNLDATVARPTARPR